MDWEVSGGFGKCPLAMTSDTAFLSRISGRDSGQRDAPTYGSTVREFDA
jgi:hypothetical protein